MSDDSVSFVDKFGEIKVIILSSGMMLNGNRQVGRFRMDPNHFLFFEMENGTKIETGNKNVIKAEMKVFKHLVQNNLISVFTFAEPFL